MKLKLMNSGEIEQAGEGESRRFSDGSSLVRAGRLPWVPWALEGMDIKVLAIDWDRGMYTGILRIKGGTVAPPHYHFGHAHAILLKGKVLYEYGTINQGDYIFESDDILHEAEMPVDTEFFAVFFDGVGGVDEKGVPDPSTIVDCMAMYRLAEQAGAAGHLLPPPDNWHWRQAARGVAVAY